MVVLMERKKKISFLELNNMKVYAISDTHFGHGKLVEYSGKPTNFTSLIYKNLGNLQGDVLIHCGDICIGDDSKWHDMFVTATKDFKKKILVRGNHDGKSDSWYYDHGWDFVCKEFRNTYFGIPIVFTHKPIQFDETVDFNIHGHMHGNKHRHDDEMGKWYGRNHIDLAPEIRDYTAINLQKLLET